MPKRTRNLKYYEAVGRRKESRARVRLYICGKTKSANIDGLKINQGEIYINHKPVANVFNSQTERVKYLTPLTLTKNQDRFAISILVNGGGRRGQLEAITHGVAAALEKVDKEAYRPLLKKAGLLTRDARRRERRKVGTGGKARRKKQSPKR